MASLTGTLISNSYQGLLKTSGSGAISANLTPMTDGLGNSTALSLSTTAAVVTSSIGSNYITANSSVIQNNTGLIGTYLDIHGIQLFSGSNFFDITADGNSFGDYQAGTLLAVSNNLGNPAVVASFQNYDNWTDGTVTIQAPLQLQTGSRITGSVSRSGSLKLSASSSFTLPLTASAAPTKGTAYFDGSALYIYNGTQYVGVSLS
jgi:hypothetical protein